MKCFIIAVIFVLLNISAYSQNAKYQEGKVYKHTLSNGMLVLTMERHIAPLVYHQLTYKVGSRNERLGITGISHIVEHMMFKGTPTFGKGKASKTITDNSGIFNAFTMNDMTSYYEYMPVDKIETAFKIESDRMQNCIFDAKEFKPEVEVIKQERRMRSESQVQGIFNETMNSIAYSSHQNRDPIIGWPGDLNSITRDMAYNYYKTFYTPNNAFLVLIGDFDTDKIMKMVDKYYSAIPQGPAVPEVYSSQEIQKVRKSFELYHNDVTAPSFRMSFHVPEYSNPDAPILKAAGMILCERSRDARLYKRLVETDRIATSCAGGFGMTKDPTLFNISVSMQPDSSLAKVEQIVWEEIKNLQNTPVSDNELQKVKNRYKFNQVTNYIKNADIGSRISRSEAYFGYEFLDKFDERVNAVTKADIQKVMKLYFNPEQVTIGYQYPKDKSKINVKKKGQSDIENNNKGGFYEDSDAFYFQPPIDAIDIINAVATNNIDEYVKPKPIEPLVKILKLDNGITLYTMEDHLVPAISIIGMFDTGVITEALKSEKPGISSFLGGLMNRGSKTKSYEELTERMSFVPFQFSVSGSHKGFYFQGYSLIENADEMMKTGQDIVFNPGLKQSEMDILKPRSILAAKNRMSKTSIKAFYYMFENIFKDHTLTQFDPTEESINSYTLEDLEKLHKKYITPNHLSIMIAGDMTTSQMRDLANKYYGNWKFSEKDYERIKMPDVKDFNKKEIRIFTDKDYTECTINIGFKPYNNCPAEEEETIAVLNHILAGSALTSRMGIELRDKQGLIYGIKSEFWIKNDNIGYWKFNTKTAPKNTEKVIKGIFSEIKKLLKDGITDEELRLAKNRQIGLLPFYVETPDDAGQLVFDMIQKKLPLNFFDQKAKRIMKITKDDVLRVAKKYLTIDKFIAAVDGPIEEHSLDNLLNDL